MSGPQTRIPSPQRRRLRHHLTDPAGKTTQYRRDGNNNVDQVTLPTGIIRTAGYTDAANAHYPTMVQNAQGKWVDLVYNGSGRTLPSTAMPANYASSATYNDNGTVKTSTDANGVDSHLSSRRVLIEIPYPSEG